MPTTSSYFSDLQYPTVNEDGTTYGGIINTYINELLVKLYTVSQRVTNAQSQLNSINQGVNAVDIINTTLAGAIGSNPLLSGTGTTLLPDPYSGTYTKTTTWPAYASSFSGYGGGAIAVPTTVSEINSFDFEGYKNVLLAELARIEAVVTQAEADILTAQQDTCRTKKIIEAYQAGGTVTRSIVRTSFSFTRFKKIHVSNTVRRYEMLNSGGVQSNVSTTLGTFTGTTVPSNFESSMPMSAGNSVTLPLYGQYGNNIMAAYPNEGQTYQLTENEVAEHVMPESAGLLTLTLKRYAENPLTFEVTLNYTPVGNAGFSSSTSSSAGSGSMHLDTYGVGTIIDMENIVTYPTPDFSSCTSPSPPYFIS